MAEAGSNTTSNHNGGARPPKIAIGHIDKAFRVNGELVVALQDVSVEAFAQEFVTIIGPSGCGKSTLFNIISGLLQPTEVSVLDGTAAQGSADR